MSEEKMKGELRTTKETITTDKMEKYDDFFILVKNDKEVRIAVTNKIVSSKTFKSFEAAKKYINSKPWELLVNVTIVINDTAKAIEAEQTKK